MSERRRFASRIGSALLWLAVLVTLFVATLLAEEEAVRVAPRRMRIWEKATTISTLLMALGTFLIVILTYVMQLEPALQIRNPTAITNTARVGNVTSNKAFCAPRGLNLASYSQQRVILFEVMNRKHLGRLELNPPAVNASLRVVNTTSIALTGVLIERMLREISIAAVNCNESGIDPVKLGTQKIPQIYELSITSQVGGDRLRISVAYARKRDAAVSRDEALFVYVFPSGARRAQSADQLLFPIAGNP